MIKKETVISSDYDSGESSVAVVYRKWAIKNSLRKKGDILVGTGVADNVVIGSNSIGVSNVSSVSVEGVSDGFPFVSGSSGNIPCYGMINASSAVSSNIGVWGIATSNPGVLSVSPSGVISESAQYSIDAIGYTNPSIAGTTKQYPLVYNKNANSDYSSHLEFRLLTSADSGVIQTTSIPTSALQPGAWFGSGFSADKVVSSYLFNLTVGASYPTRTNIISAALSNGIYDISIDDYPDQTFTQKTATYDLGIHLVCEGLFSYFHASTYVSSVFSFPFLSSVGEDLQLNISSQSVSDSGFSASLLINKESNMSSGRSFTVKFQKVERGA